MAGVHFKVTGDANGYMAATRQAEAATTNLTRKVESEGAVMDAMFKQLAISVGGFFSAQAAYNFTQKIASVRGEFQQLEVAFETILQSKEKADALMNQVINTAATTPFNLKEVANGTKQLLAYGVASEDVNGTLIRLGDIAAGLSIPLGDLVYLYGTTMAQGRMFTQDLRQFQGRGIPMVDALAEVMGVAKNQVAGLVTEGKVGFAEMQKAIESLTDKGSKFGGLMEKQSKTITGQIRNLEDSIEQMFNEIGKASEGAISGALGVASNLVENYEKVGKVIGQLVVTYGAYKAVVATVSAINVAAAKAEKATLTELLAVKTGEAAATQTEITSRGKAAAAIMSEVAALKLELDERVKNLTTTMLAAKGEEAAARTKVELLSVQVGLAKMRSAQAKEELALAIASGDAAAIEAAKTKLATAAKEQNTVSRQLGVATRNLEIATSNAEAATSARNTLVNNIETASIEKQTTATLMLAEAKKKLSAIGKNIVATLSNPYVLAGAAVAALAFSVWGLVDSLNVEEKAHKNVREELEKMNAALDNNRSKAEGLIQVIQDETSTEMMRVKALNELRTLYPQLYKGMSDQEIITLKQAQATKQLAEETERLREEELKRLLQEKKEALAEQEGTNTVYGANGAAYQVNTGNSLQAKRLRAEIKDLEEQVNELNKLREQAEFNAMPKEAKIISLNQQIEDLKAQNLELDTQIAETMAKKWTIEELGNLDFDWGSSATADDLLAKQEANVKAIEELMRRKSEIEDEDTGADTQTDKQKAADDKRKKARLKAQKELEKMERDLNYKTTQANIDSMEEGYAKTLKQLEFNLEKEKDAIEDHKQELLDKKYNEALQNWLAEDSERKAYDFKFTATLTQEELELFNQMGDLAQQEFNRGREKADAKWEKEGEFAVRQFSIDAMAEGTDKDAAQRQLDNEKELHNLEQQRQAYIEAARAAHIFAVEKGIASGEFDEAKANSNFDQVLINTKNRQTEEQLNALKLKYEDFAQAIVRIDTDLAGELAQMKNKDGSLITGFSQENIDNAVKAAEDAKDALAVSIASQDAQFDIFLGTIVDKSINELTLMLAQAKIELTTLEDMGGDSGELARARAEIVKLEEQIKKLRVDKGVKESTTSWADLSNVLKDAAGTFSELGNIIPGVQGQMLAGIGSIASAAVGMANGIQAIEKGLSATEKASAILAVISAAMQVVQFFTSALKENEEANLKTAKATDSYREALEDLDESSNKAKNSTIFGDDPFGSVSESAKNAQKHLVDLQSSIDNVSLFSAEDLIDMEMNSSGWSTFSKKLGNKIKEIRKIGDTALVSDNRSGWQKFWGIGNDNLVVEDLTTFIGEDGNLKGEELKAWYEAYGEGLSEEDKQIVEGLIHDWDDYAAAMEEVTSYVKSIFGDMSSQIADSMIESWQKTGNAIADTKKILGDYAKTFAKSMIESMLIQQVFTDDVQQQMIDLMSTGDTEGALALTSQLLDKANAIAPQINEYLNGVDSMTGGALSGDQESTRESASKGIAQASQDSVDELNGRMTAVQSHTFSINERVGTIVNLTSQILAKVTSIDGHTARLETIETNTANMADHLSDILTRGIKVK